MAVCTKNIAIRALSQTGFSLSAASRAIDAALVRREASGVLRAQMEEQP
jgi:hypothetical protein